MSRLSKVLAVFHLFGAMSISSCAGELTDAQKELPDGQSSTGGTGGSGGFAGAGGGASGSGGATGANPEACMVALVGTKQCALVGCHGAGSMPAAQLVLTESVIRQPKDQLVDKMNKGNHGAASSCPAGSHKLVDTAQPEKSLLYTKLTAQPPCGGRMPGGEPLTEAEMSCVLNWIKSIPK